MGPVGQIGPLGPNGLKVISHTHIEIETVAFTVLFLSVIVYAIKQEIFKKAYFKLLNLD